MSKKLSHSDEEYIHLGRVLLTLIRETLSHAEPEAISTCTINTADGGKVYVVTCRSEETLKLLEAQATTRVERKMEAD